MPTSRSIACSADRSWRLSSICRASSARLSACRLRTSCGRASAPSPRPGSRLHPNHGAAASSASLGDREQWTGVPIAGPFVYAGLGPTRATRCSVMPAWPFQQRRSDGSSIAARLRAALAGPPYRRRVVLLSSLLLGFALLAPSVASATSTDQAVAYQLDPAHDGDQTGNPITAPLSQAWSISLPGSISYPLIVNGVVYVTARKASGYGTTLYALDQATGATLWSHFLGGTYDWSGLAYDNGQVFTVNFDGDLTAFDATTGAVNWTISLPGQHQFTSPPTAIDGYVYTGGAGTGGTLYAVSEATGEVAWTAPVANGQNSSPAVDSNGVYVTYAADQDYAFNPFTGALLWHHGTGAEGGGGKTPVLAGGDVFGRDAGSGNVVLSAADGTSVGSFPSTRAPAIGGGQAYMLEGASLASVNDSGLGTIAWTFTGDSMLDTAPLLVGNLVFEGSASGEVYAVDPSGASVWSANAGSAIAAPDEQDVSQPLTGLGAGEQTLIVPAGSTLVAYASASVGTGTPSNTSAPTITGTPSVGHAVGADVGGWSALPSSYTYQWSRCDAGGGSCASIDDANGESYTPTTADIGSTLELTVTASNASGTSAAASSAASSPVPPLIPANLAATDDHRQRGPGPDTHGVRRELDTEPDELHISVAALRERGVRDPDRRDLEHLRPRAVRRRLADRSAGDRVQRNRHLHGDDLAPDRRNLDAGRHADDATLARHAPRLDHSSDRREHSSAGRHRRFQSAEDGFDPKPRRAAENDRGRAGPAAEDPAASGEARRRSESGPRERGRDELTPRRRPTHGRLSRRSGVDAGLPCMRKRHVRILRRFATAGSPPTTRRRDRTVPRRPPPGAACNRTQSPRALPRPPRARRREAGRACSGAVAPGDAQSAVNVGRSAGGVTQLAGSSSCRSSAATDGRSAVTRRASATAKAHSALAYCAATGLRARSKRRTASAAVAISLTTPAIGPDTRRLRSTSRNQSASSGPRGGCCTSL